MNMRPWLMVLPPPPLPPVDADIVSIAGSACTIFTICSRIASIAWNEVSWSARIVPCMRPLSCCGKNPLGTLMNRYTFSPIVATSTSSVIAGCRSTRVSVRP